MQKSVNVASCISIRKEWYCKRDKIMSSTTRSLSCCYLRSKLLLGILQGCFNGYPSFYCVDCTPSSLKLGREEAKVTNVSGQSVPFGIINTFNSFFIFQKTHLMSPSLGYGKSDQWSNLRIWCLSLFGIDML